ncbi:D-isomer specific 2-hydroxyacid dehydrogenase NAD-binding [Penicillium chermesinum]|uniref:D-isomer specific 2-hydroxyacid dehydrogenase NAD-binding n=1 Tax=Penicillium chermesinum TaxID=63820 RepID=A0A9W9NBT0_9EURO|nr:D-isomer specific 2-hydroxyacid dehydrogenase NAD-binding [Penicillium chermesinum]KAJ5216929.1 D-isomer specific 2-hydroxyacid dehydrogenase NAD-binding [Penicillium chermesinum]KAJ6171459.1 D-isomer specific 2-hydroxyacid dehydrogenase NAD-binding [Penicillium chermesinum]
MTLPVKPRVVALGEPKFVGADYLAEFRKTFDYSFLPVSNRAETQQLLPTDIAANGPIDAFIIRMGTPPFEPFDEGLLGALVPNCKIIVSASAGYNEFDLQWMNKEGILFCNTLDAVAEATADMALFLILAVLRNTWNAEKSLRNGIWRLSGCDNLVPTRDPSGLTLGIVGMGAIGKYIAKKAASFNMRIIYHNRNQLPEGEETKYNATYYKSLHGLLAQSDVVSISCPLNAQTTGLIGEAEFAVMKDGVFLVNTARGAIVDEKALISALESGKVTRAGLDVFANEPSPNPWFFQSDQVILQPHMGDLTDIAYQKAERECFENIRAFFTTGKANSPVNIRQA